MTAPEVVFFDGACGLCHGAVRFVVRRDHAARFAFAPLAGTTAAATFTAEERAALPDSLVVRTADGRTLVRSDAVVHLLRGLGSPWRAVGRALGAIPRPLRDAGYRAVARVRRSLWSRPPGACPVVAPALRSRLLG